jgi:DNA repair and recombination protein RAD52
MAFTDDQIASLKAPLAREHVKTRAQAGRQLSYIEGWVAIAEANRIFGFDGWDRETVDMRLVVERETKIGREPQRDGWRVAYVAKVTVRVNIQGPIVIRQGTGYGSGIDVDLGAAHESAVKEAETDAMKRALMTFGNPFGLALYDKQQTEVAPPEPPRRPGTAERERQWTGEPPDMPAAAQQAMREGNGVDTASLRAARDRIIEGINGAATPTDIDRVIAGNTVDLALIKHSYGKTYETIMGVATSRRNELLSGA